MPTTLLIEQFAAAPVADAWPTGWTASGTDTGDTWTAGVGALATANAHNQYRLVTHADVAVRAFVSLSALPSSSNADLYFNLRRITTGSGSRYYALLRVTSAGVVQGSLVRVVEGATTVIVATTTLTGIGTYVANDRLRVRFTIRGATLGFYVWRVGTARPAQPQLTIADANIAAGTSVGMGVGVAPGIPAWSLYAPLRYVTLVRAIDARRAGVVRA